MNLNLSRKHRLLPLLALTLSLAFQACAEDGARGKDSNENSLEDVIQKLADAPWPVGFDFFRSMGAGEFKQQSSSNADPVVFRSSPIETRDGYRIAHTEFRIHPRLMQGISFFYAKLEQGHCYPAASLKENYALERFMYPPSPHNAAAERVSRESAYELRSNGTVVHFTTDGSRDECLLSFYRAAR